MYKYKVFTSENGLWVENEKEIRTLGANVNKAIEIVIKKWKRLSPYSVYPIDVSGGCHERDTGYETFSGGFYPYYGGTDCTWIDMLVDDFKKEAEEKLDGTWFTTLNFATIRVMIVGRYGPIVLTFRRGEMAVTICYDEEYKNEETALLNEFEQVFGAV